MEFCMRVSMIAVALVSSMFSCQKFTQSLNQGLEDEKSYTRHAMETYRKNPKVFHENKSVLETWSRSDYVAVAVAQQNKSGNWAETSDKLNFLDPKVQSDTTGRPFCVIHQDDRIVVLSIRSAANSTCSSELLNGVDLDRIKSGDMEFSGRTDYWVYVLRPGQGKSKYDHQPGQ